MFRSFKRFYSCFGFGFGIVALFLTHLCKMSPILGSSCSFFSLADALMPLTGIFGIGAALIAAFARGSLSFLANSHSLFSLVYHTPGFCASASWAYSNKLTRCVLPLACMILFWAHPVGFRAAPYALYWVIPVFIFFSKKKGIFLQALSATFIAHAVGSVIWLYLKALPVAIWWALIPVVPFERLSNAALMTVGYYGVREGIRVMRFLKSHWIARSGRIAKNQ